MAVEIKCPTTFEHMAEADSILLNLILFAVIYIVWSLIQKKR